MKNILCVVCVFCCGLAIAGCNTKPRAAAASFEHGRMLYTEHCAACHGTRGDGQGPLAITVSPSPRDLTSGIFKYRTTRGPIPSNIDLMQTLKHGIPGTSMPGWNMLSAKDWQSLLLYMKRLVPRLANETPGARVTMSEHATPTKATIGAGQALYHSLGCVSCHGASGRGDGKAAATLTDAWSDPIVPRDLREGRLKWGNSEADFYRTLLLGIPGTPMPGYEQSLTPAQIWSLVDYLKSIQRALPKGFDPSSPQRHLVQAGHVAGALPLHHTDPLWQQQRGVPVFLNALWAKTSVTEWVMVHAIHNDRDIAFYLHWKDPHPNTDATHSDAVAVQFPLDQKIQTPSDLPFIAMGSATRPVQIWRWSPGGVVEWNAAGPFARTKQERGHTQVQGSGVYADGEWHVVVKRTFAPTDPSDATVATPLGYLGIAVWDGEGRTAVRAKAFSEWLRYELLR